MDGVIVIDKPAGWTSHDVVAKMRRLANERSIGHLGTLDPMATGVLPLITGRATRLAKFFTSNDKRYDAVIRFGVETDSYDKDGEVTARSDGFEFSRDELEAALYSFRGTFAQTPPAVSAKKIGGVPAYKLARKKVDVRLKAVEVTVFSIDVLEFSGAAARVIIHCGGGTYVRSIAHDLGRKLGCGAILEDLRRVSSGDFTIEQGYTLDEVRAKAELQQVEDLLIPAVKLLPQFPCERVDQLTAGQIRQGRPFRVSPFRAVQESQYVKAISGDGDLVAIGEIRLPHLYHPVLVF